MIQGGWVCRACWKSNRPGDDRCYRCKTPREEQLTVEAGSLKEVTAPGYKVQNRMDSDLGLLAAFVAWPMLISGWLGIIGSVLLFGLALLGLLSSEQTGALFLGIIAAVGFVFSGLWIFVARSVRRQARWAYVIAAINYMLGSAPALLGFIDVPREALEQLPDWYLVAQNVITVVYLILGIGALILLVASFVRKDDDVQTPAGAPG